MGATVSVSIMMNVLLFHRDWFDLQSTYHSANVNLFFPSEIRIRGQNDNGIDGTEVNYLVVSLFQI